MEAVLALAIGILVACGVWLLLRPRTFQVIIQPGESVIFMENMTPEVATSERTIFCTPTERATLKWSKPLWSAHPRNGGVRMVPASVLMIMRQ